MYRHLAEPKNKIEKFEFTALLGLLPKLQISYNRHFVEDDGQWRRGRGLAKLRRIDVSCVEDRNEFGKVKLMVKKEVYPQSVEDPQGIKKARGIQFTVNEKSNYEFADQAHAWSSSLGDATREWQEFRGVKFLLRYAAHMDHAEMGDFMTQAENRRRLFSCTWIDERDGKNWDSNIQREHREGACDFYEKLDPVLSRWARAGVAVKGCFRSKFGTSIRYEVDGTVKSGHFDTSSMNGATNREVTMQAVVGLPNTLRPIEVMGLVMGDDYLAWLYFDMEVDPNALRDALDEQESLLGIVPERGLFQDVRNASFISLGLYRSVDGHVVCVPKLGRMFYKLFWTTADLQARDPRRLASGVAAAFYPLYQTYPPARMFLKYHMRVPPLGVNDLEPYYRWAELGLTRLPHVVNWAENHLVKYGLDSLVLDLTTVLGGEQTAGLCHSEIVDRMYREDVSDPCDRRGCATACPNNI